MMFPAAGGRDDREAQDRKKRQKGTCHSCPHLAMFPKLQSACLQAMMGGMHVAAVASPWIMEGWLASFHRPCRATNLPASKTCCCVEPFLLAFGTAESNQPASKFREDDEGASRATTSSDPSVTAGMTHCERGTDVMSDKSLANHSASGEISPYAPSTPAVPNAIVGISMQGWPHRQRKHPSFLARRWQVLLSSRGDRKAPGSINVTTGLTTSIARDPLAPRRRPEAPDERIGAQKGCWWPYST